MTIEFASEDAAWLEYFFSGRNVLRWPQIISGEGPPAWISQVEPWLRVRASSASRVPIVLPMFSDDGPASWYGICEDIHALTRLSAELDSLVGPSYGHLSHHATPSLEDDEVESVLKMRFGKFVIRLSPIASNDRPKISELLAVYQSVVARRPPTPDRTQRPFGQVRGEFDRALLAGNEKNANSLLEELAKSGRISTEQRRCLEIRLLAGLGRWEELARNRALVASVVELSLPPQTIADLVEALYESYISPLQEIADVHSLIATFKQNVASRYGPLFRERKGIRRSKVLRAFLLFELSQADINIARCEAILSAHTDDPTGLTLAQRWFDAVRPKVVASRPDPRDSTRQAIADEDYEIAVGLATASIPEQWAYSALLRCAVEIKSSDLTHRVLALVDSAAPSIQESLSAKDRLRRDILRSAIPQELSLSADADWVSWARWVAGGKYNQSPVLLLESATLAWSVDSYVRNPDQCLELARLISNARGPAEAVFRDAFPALIEFFVEQPVNPARSFVPLYGTLIKVLAWSGAISADELELASSLLLALLAVGPSKQEYRECVEDLCEIAASNGSVAYLDWALNVSEALAIFPMQDTEGPLRLFTQTVAKVHSIGHRVSAAQRDVLIILAQDYGCVDLIHSLPISDVVSATGASTATFDGLIGIYSLMEAAGKRAQRLLSDLLPNARIELNSDGVATDRLKALAANADIFVFAWKSSKHQAYFCAKEARGGRDLLMPLGKGTASIVRSVVDQLSSQVS